jgi:hypothetical protein
MEELIRMMEMHRRITQAAIAIINGDPTMIHYHETFKTKEDAEAFIERVCKSYHPLGYGTYFQEPVQQEDGKWLVTGSRSASCD